MILIASAQNIDPDTNSMPLPKGMEFQHASCAHAKDQARNAEAIIVPIRGITDIAFAAEIKSTTQAPLIVIVAAEDEGLIGQALMAGAVDFISTPVTEMKLTARITSALRLKAALAHAVAARSSVSTPTSYRPCRTSLIAHRAAFKSAVAALEPFCEGICGMILIRHTGLLRDANEIGDSKAELETAMSNLLASVHMPAGDMLAGLGDGIYVHLALGLNNTELQARADKYADALSEVESKEFGANAFEVSIQIDAAADTPLAQRLAAAITATHPKLLQALNQ
ncbi:MAG: hypothetical protein WBG95_16050 [Sulfitobacter sp.]